MSKTLKRKVMQGLANRRHEKFAQLVASGLTPTAAYVSLGYSKARAPQAAHNLLQRADVRARVDLATRSSAEEIAFDRMALDHLGLLSRKAEELGQVGVMIRCEKLIGDYLGMFDRGYNEFESNGNLSELSDSSSKRRKNRWRKAMGYLAGRPPRLPNLGGRRRPSSSNPPHQ